MAFRQRQADRWTDRQKIIQKDKQTEGQSDRHTENKTIKWMN